MNREEILKSVNYRQQEIKCCETCKHSYYEVVDGLFFCNILEEKEKTKEIWVCDTGICDKYEG